MMQPRKMKNVIFKIALIVGSTCTAMSASANTVSATDQPGVVTNLITTTGLNTAAIIGGTVSGFAAGGSNFAENGLKRFALSGQGTGLAGAPGGKSWNAWTAYSHSNIGFNFSPLQSSGDVNVYLVGVDYTFANNMIFGVATAIDRSSIDLNFSGGKLDGRGVTVSPYLGIPINKNMAFDATVGVGRTNLDTNTAGVSGSTRDNRTLGTMGLTYREVIGAWSLSGRGALLAVRDKLGAYTLTNGTFVPDGTVNVTQMRLVGQVAYTAGNFTPYVSLSYINDLHRPDQAPVAGITAANDKDAWTPAIGVRFRADNSFYGSIQYSSERARSDVKNNQLLLNVGIRF
jgi:hypothetical protein